MNKTALVPATCSYDPSVERIAGAQAGTAGWRWLRCHADPAEKVVSRCRCVSYRDPFGLAPVDDIYYDEYGKEIRRVETDEPDQYFLEYQGLTYALDYGLVESSTPYIIHTDHQGFDWMATALANQAAPYRNRLVIAAQSLPGRPLDFKRNIPDRSLFNAGGGLMTHKHALGNAAWGYYMKKMGFGVGEALRGARLQGATRGGEDALDQQMIRRGFAIP